MAEHIILLVEPMFVLVCLAGLPGTPRRAVDVVGLVLLRWLDLVWQWQWQCKSAGDENN